MRGDQHGLFGNRGWLLAVFGFVEFRVFLSPLGIAFKALRFGPVVFFAPISLGLEFGSRLRTTHAAFGFWNAMFGAPPAGMIALGRRFLRLNIATSF